ncbi:sensor histidine kinase [Micromonospora chersina]|uniref:sensor histidine kinase n=1 Tax=Micromonospora chersina TaxID=47854 RepID=UPI0037116F8F
MSASRRSARPELRRAVRYFLLLNALAITVVAGAASLWSIHLAQRQAAHFAEQSARGMADWLIAPLCTPQLRAGDPAALRALDDVVRARMQDGSVTRVKVWTFDGRILYSDQTELIGRRYPLADEDRALMGTHRVNAEISDLDRAENEFEQPVDRLVEVYLSMSATDGEPLLFEAYFPADQVDADARWLGWQLAPTALLTIIVLQLLQLPLALTLASRLDTAHRERGRLLEHAVAASDLERRRVARDLHDGVVQDLAGVGYRLGALALQLPDEAGALRPAVCGLADMVRQDVRSLRQVMMEVYPPDLAETGLAVAVEGLLEPLRAAGTVCQVRLPETSALPQGTVQLLYRAAREALRNVDKHARAGRLDVTLTLADDARLTVADDGVGFDPAAPPAEPGHLGMRLLDEAVRDARGSLTVASVPGEGTVLTVLLPLDGRGPSKEVPRWPF